MTYCDLCGEDDGWVELEYAGDVLLQMCQDCQKKTEDLVNYSHVVEEIVCKTCHHKRYKMRRYNASDKGVIECHGCRKFFKMTETIGGLDYCDKCAKEEHERLSIHKGKDCPDCYRELDWTVKTKINGWIVGQYSCKCGYLGDEQKLRKMDKLPPPDRVKPLEEWVLNDEKLINTPNGESKLALLGG